MTQWIRWIISDWAHAFVTVQMVGTALVAAWGAYKAAYFKVTGKPLRRTRWTLAADIGAELMNNLLGALNKVLVARGGAPLFPPGGAPQEPPNASPEPPRAPPGPGVLPLLLVACGAALLPSLSGCDPSQHDPVRYGTVAVYVSPAWSARDRARIESELRALQALGPAFVVTDTSERADVIVTLWTSPDCATAGAGGHTLGTRVAEVDPTCAPGDGAFRAFVGHEIGHALGMLHVCTVHETGADCSPTVRGSPAMMARSPFVDSRDPVIGLVAVDTPQALDLEEFARVRGAARGP